MSKYFSDIETSCKCCGVNGMNIETLKKFDRLRELVGEPLPMSSGYRCEKYNSNNGYTQTHATGRAGDLQVSHEVSFLVLKYCHEVGFTGIGVNQKGKSRFIHLDDLTELPKRPRPHVWSY